VFGLRFLWGAFFTGYTAGGATKLMDYPDNGSRGKFLSFMLVAQLVGSAIFTAFFSSRLLSWLTAAGLSDADALRAGFWIISLLPISGIVVALLFLEDDTPAPGTRPAATVTRFDLRRLLAGFAVVWTQARARPRLAAVMLIGSAIRTDGIIMSSFLGLWIIQAGQEQGIAPIEATRTIGTLSAINTVASFALPPLFGWLADRVDRLTLLIVSVGMMGVAFCAFGLVDDVFSVWMIVVVVMVGLSEGAQHVSASALLSEECPADIRGTAVGVYTFLGTASVLVVTFAAGLLYDLFSPRTPFVMEGVLNLAVFCGALALVRWQAGKRVRTA
jgi:MFS family permease